MERMNRAHPYTLGWERAVRPWQGWDVRQGWDRMRGVCACYYVYCVCVNGDVGIRFWHQRGRGKFLAGFLSVLGIDFQPPLDGADQHSLGGAHVAVARQLL